MASILENVKRNLSTAPASPELGAQQQAQTLARATTGKAVGLGSTPALSEQQQGQAQLQTQQAQAEVTQAGQQVAQQLGRAETQLKQEVRRSQRQLSERELSLKEQMFQKLDSTLNQYSQEFGKLEMDKSAAQAEQVGFMLRLGSEQYVHKLQIEGAKARLTDKFAFQEALQRAIFSEERQTLQNNLRIRSMIRSEDRQFREQLQEFDLDTALAMAAIETQANNAVLRYQGVGEISKAAITGATGIAEHMPERPTPTPTSTPTPTPAPALNRRGGV